MSISQMYYRHDRSIKTWYILQTTSSLTFFLNNHTSTQPHNLTYVDVFSTPLLHTYWFQSGLSVDSSNLHNCFVNANDLEILMVSPPVTSPSSWPTIKPSYISMTILFLHPISISTTQIHNTFQYLQCIILITIELNI